MLDRRSSDRNSDGYLGGILTSGYAAIGPDQSGSAGGASAGSETDNKNRSREGAASLGQLAGVRVLLVEDDDDSRNLLGLILGRYGARVIPASSAAEALHSFQETAPDIIISDIGMVEGDGYALLRKLRALPVHGSLLRRSADSSIIGHNSSSPVSSLIIQNSLIIPAIALTGYATLKDRERALSAGYQLHLAKPVEPEDLVAAIVSLVGSA
jgi:CheY-like chemotaxis protein